MRSLARKKYFVYVLSMDEAGEYPFYVGKGSNQRPYDHMRDAMNFALSLKCAVIRYLVSHKQCYWIDIVYTTNDEDDAYWHEMKTITSYPPKSLCNVYSSHRAPSYRMSIEKRSNGLWQGVLLDPGNKPVFETWESVRIGVVRDITEHHDELVLPPYLKSTGFAIIKSTRKRRKQTTMHTT